MSIHAFYVSLNGTETEISKSETLLGVTLDNDLKLNAHIKSLCREVAHKLTAFSQVRKYLTFDQKL